METRVVILGGGFGGIYAALQFDRSPRDGFEVTLISEDNFFLFTPMLSEVATSSIDTRHIVNPIRRLFRHVHFIEARIEAVDFGAQEVIASIANGESLRVPYDHVVIALGSVTNYFNLPGVEANSLPVKTLADAIVVRNRVIQRLEEADVSSPDQRTSLLTFVVAGGGLAGVEVAGDLNAFVRDAAKVYHNVRPEMIRVMLVEGGPRLMPELSASLGEFARGKLTERGAEVHLHAPVESATSESVTIGNLGEIATRNLVWTAGVSATPFVRSLGIPLEKGRIVTDRAMRLPGRPSVWAVGDVARIPDGRGGYYPMTAQHAVREGKRVARNIMRVARGRAPRPFRYQTLGMLSTVGHESGVGEVLGLKISGFPAWWMWRSYYLLRLPRLEKRIRVVIDWTLDLIFPRDIVQLKMVPSDEEAKQD